MFKIDDDLDEARARVRKKICSAIYYSISDPTRDVVWPKEGGTFGRKKEETKTKERREVEGR